MSMCSRETFRENKSVTFARRKKMNNHTEYSLVFKALGDTTRLKIVEMLSCGELCGCDILEAFNITQPTLSYHMKILTECKLVTSHKEGSWIYYKNNLAILEEISGFWNGIIVEQEDCICKNIKEVGTCV